MMRTPPAVAAVLALLAVAQCAPLSCEKLMKPAGKVPDEITGTWYLLAMSTDSFWYDLLIKVFFWGSYTFDITVKETPNAYCAMMTMTWFGFCVKESPCLNLVSDSLLNKGSVYDRGSTISLPDSLVHTDCPDCMVIREADESIYLIMSRRQTVTDAEMDEFKRQIRCFGWRAPKIMLTDNGNCTNAEELFREDNMDDWSTILSDHLERWYNSIPNIDALIPDF